MLEEMHLPDAVAADIIRHAREAAPDECCGLLMAQGARIVQAVRARNIAESPSRSYTIDPADHFRVLRAAREQHLDIIGAYHSHPNSRATPSATDLALAFSNFLFVIVGLAQQDAEITAWELVSGNFGPVPLVRTP